MDKKTEVGEPSMFEKLETVKNELSMHLYEIETMIALGEEAAIAETEGNKSVEEWSVVFSIIGHIQKMAQGKINELDLLLAEQRVRERQVRPIATN